MFAKVKPFIFTRKNMLILLALSIVIAITAGIFSWRKLARALFGIGDPSGWDEEDIAQYLEVPFPTDATDIKYSVGPQYHFFINLSFKAPPKSAAIFTDHICDGLLYQGYDPFNAIDSRQVSPDAYLIKIWPGYYSRSPNPPKGYSGNRCTGLRGFDNQISVDVTDPNLYSVKFELPVGCGYTCYSPYYTFISPTSRFFIGVTGISKTIKKDEYLLVMNEMCLETRSEFMEQSSYLIGADVEISIDDQLMPSAYISNDGTLLTKFDADGNLTKGKNEKFSAFNYCLRQKWPKGLHTMNIQIVLKSGTKDTDSWKFRVE